MSQIRLTEYSHSAGCGCKFVCGVQDEIHKSYYSSYLKPSLMLGNETRDYAAVYDLGNGSSVKLITIT